MHLSALKKKYLGFRELQKKADQYYRDYNELKKEINDQEGGLLLIKFAKIQIKVQLNTLENR